MLMTRGVMIDVASYKGVPMLGDTYEIPVEDLEGEIKKQNLTFQPGDAIIVHTGWGKLWNTDPGRYGKGNPGIGVKAAEFLIAKDPILLGADTAPVEVNPNPDKLISLPLHQIALVGYAVHLLENLKLPEPPPKNVPESASVCHPLTLEAPTHPARAPCTR